MFLQRQLIKWTQRYCVIHYNSKVLNSFTGYTVIRIGVSCYVLCILERVNGAPKTLSSVLTSSIFSLLLITRLRTKQFCSLPINMAGHQLQQTKGLLSLKKCLLVLAIASLATTATILTAMQGNPFKWNLRNGHSLELESSTWPLDRIYRERRKRAQQECSKLSESEREKTRHMFKHYDSRSNSLYCSVPKIGSSTWKRIFLMIIMNQTGDPQAMSGLHIHFDGRLDKHNFMKQPESERSRISEDAFSFMFSRDPFRRVFSAFCDKVLMWTHEGRQITNGIRDAMRRSNDKNRGGSDVKQFDHTIKELNLTFADIMDHIARVPDIHFLPVSRLCNPCETSYDVLGKMETFDVDTEYILDKLNRSYLVQPPTASAQSKTSRDLSIITELVKRSFTTLEDHLLRVPGEFGDSPSVIKFKSLIRMWKTFHVRGLVSDAIRFPLNVSEVEKVTHTQMASLAQQALKDSGEEFARAAQKDKYYRQAFRSVPLETLKRFSQFAQTDCNLFGYDCEPPDIFQGRVSGDEEDSIFSSDRLIYEGTTLVP